MTAKLRRERKKIILALVIFAVLMIIHVVAEHKGADAGTFWAVLNNRWVMFVLFLVPYLIVGRDVVRNAFLGIKNRQMFDESLLMTLATFGAFATGENAEACAVMLFYQIGEFFQKYAVGKSRGSISELMELAPEFANIRREDGSIEVIDPEEVEIGDILVIKPGEKIPVDGTVISGLSMVNTAALTGEPVPRSASEGDQIISGCINGDGLLTIRADKKYEDSTVSRILELVENASSRKSKTENFITRFARYYTPIVVFGAIALAVIPSIFTGDPLKWIYRACTFLVISCPCALVISVPLSFFGGIGAASSAGVLVKGSNYLELMAQLDTVVTDKTGTLTKGDFVVNRIVPAQGVSEEELLLTAASAESLSSHPIALSIKAACESRFAAPESDGDALPEMTGVRIPVPEDVENISGKGLKAVLADGTVLAGNAAFLEENGITAKQIKDDAATIVYVAKNGAYLGAILIADEIKLDSADAIAQMKAEGVKRVVMLTGDRAQAAGAVAERLGIDETYSELLPQDKVSKVEELLAKLGTEDDPKRKRLAFIGDGINDAPVLSRADVGIAMGSMGSDAAIEAADIVIMDDDLTRIPRVIRIARKTVRIATENIWFAIGVKVLILVLGALGMANMWAAVFADVGVAFLCILNSMRMLAKKSV